MGVLKENINGITVRNCSSDGIIGKLFTMYNLSFFRKRFYKNFYKEHLYTCKEIFSSFLDKKREDKNYTVLYAPTQAGKTTCMTLLVNIISEADFKKILNINLVIYLTGDNQCGLINQTRDRFEEQTNNPVFFIEDDKETPEDEVDDTVINIKSCQENGQIPVLLIKQSDCKKAVSIFNRYNDFFKNTLIMIDESHFGTKNKGSQVNVFLEAIGCDLANSHDKLINNNIFILSVSATPWNELFSDDYYKSDKKTIYYQPGESYKGLQKFIYNNNIKGIENGIDNVEDFKLFLNEQYKKIKKIGKNPGKAIIFRINDKGLKISEKELKSIVINEGFTPYILSSKTSRINYEDADYRILGADKVGRPLAIIIYEAYKHGISINGQAKKEIVTVYDFRKSKSGDAIDATEQGLLGRMCGYDEVDLENLEIYINKAHYDGLLNHNDGRGLPSTVVSKTDFVECSKEEWKNQEIPEGKDKFDFVLVKREKNITFKLDDFIEKNIEKYGKENIHNLLIDFDNKPKKGIIANIIRDFVKEAIENKKIKVNLKEDRFIEGRRFLKTKDSFVDSVIGEGKYIHINKNRNPFKSEKQIDEKDYGWGGVICSIDKNGKGIEKGVTLTISYGIPVYAKQKITKENVKRKLYDGYKPEIIAPITIAN